MLIIIELNDNFVKIKSDSGKKVVRVSTGNKFSEVVDISDNINAYIEETDNVNNEGEQ